MAYWRGLSISRSMPVRSRNASSMDRGSTTGEYLSNILKISLDTSLYRRKFPSTKIPWGQSCIALAVVMAERTPNFLAS